MTALAFKVSTYECSVSGSIYLLLRPVMEMVWLVPDHWSTQSKHSQFCQQRQRAFKSKDSCIMYYKRGNLTLFEEDYRIGASYHNKSLSMQSVFAGVIKLPIVLCWLVSSKIDSRRNSVAYRIHLLYGGRTRPRQASDRFFICLHCFIPRTVALPLPFWCAYSATNALAVAMMMFDPRQCAPRRLRPPKSQRCP